MIFLLLRSFWWWPPLVWFACFPRILVPFVCVPVPVPVYCTVVYVLPQLPAVTWPVAEAQIKVPLELLTGICTI